MQIAMQIIITEFIPVIIENGQVGLRSPQWVLTESITLENPYHMPWTVPLGFSVSADFRKIVLAMKTEGFKQ